MATGTNAIATEGEVKSKINSFSTVTTNKGCTKTRAIAIGANPDYFSSYTDNLLVKYSDIYALSSFSTFVNYNITPHIDPLGSGIVAYAGKYNFYDISDPNMTNEDIDSYASYWMSLGDSYSIPSRIYSDTSSKNIEVCLIFDEYVSSYYTVSVFWADQASGSPNAYFDMYYTDNYIIAVFSGEFGVDMSGEIYVQWTYK